MPGLNGCAEASTWKELQKAIMEPCDDLGSNQFPMSIDSL